MSSHITNDLRHVVLTPVVMKCFEDIVRKYQCKQVNPLRDTIQCAHSKGRSVAANITLLHHITEHLDTQTASRSSGRVETLVASM